MNAHRAQQNVDHLTIAQVIGAAERFSAQNEREKAIALYRVWLTVNMQNPRAYAVVFNLGVLLKELGQDMAAEEAYRRAIELNPECFEAQFNLGSLLEHLNRPLEAIAQWQLLLGKLSLPRDKSICLLTLNNIGRLLETTKAYKLAEEFLTASIKTDPQQNDVMQHLVYLRQKQCSWPVYKPYPGVDTEMLFRATGALSLLAASDDPERQLERVERYAKEKITVPPQVLSNGQGYGHSRLRIGYLSSDFCMHPVAMLTVELFELHDRSKVEVYGFCWSREDGSSLRRRVIKAFDHYTQIGGMSDEEAARHIRELEIDVLVDLHGLTLGSRPNILAYRPAPVQVTYLGFPGTSGIPGVDYILADKYVLPEEEARFFSERPLYLSKCFQVSDCKREIGATPTRASCGLPKDGFVFCCFNNNYKFTPEVFSIWIRIVKRVPGSVLWLLADNEWAKENLCLTAEAQGVARERLVFAGRASPPDYLARYLVADMFLDTRPFGAGTTANDALWMGLPVLTCPGRTFASRMAGSLLNALGLPELIAANLEDYEEKAVAIGCNPRKAVALKKRLHSCKKASALFNTSVLVKEIEELFFRAMQAENVRNLTPAEADNPKDRTGLAKSKPIRLAVYTVLVGEKEALNNPLHFIGSDAKTDITIDFFCFTDNEALTSPVWQIKKFDHPLIPTEKLSRLPKAQPYRFLPDYEHSLYIDNTVVFKRLPRRSDILGGVFRAFRHPWRDTPVDEADIVVKSGLDSAEVVAAQVNFYGCQRPRLLSSIQTLTAGTVLLREHHHPTVQRFGELWWEQILLFSKRDQISLDLCAFEAGCPVDYFDGDKTNNDLFIWPVLPSGRRVQGSFDAERYAWENRPDSDAVRHPRTHFLAHGGDGKKYDRRTSWFGYVCDRMNSTFGKTVPPRRGLADIVDSLLSQMVSDPGDILLVGVQSNGRLAAEPEELATAEAALVHYFRYSKQPEIVTALIRESELEESPPFRAAHGRFDFSLIVVFGLSGQSHGNALAKFLPLLAENGRLLVAFDRSLDIQSIERMQEPVANKGTLEVLHSSHISSNGVVPSSVFVLSLNRV